MNKFEEIASQFNVKGDIINVAPFGDGHINDTFLIECPERKYMLQRINHNIFTRPDQVMENIKNICKHIRKKVKEEGGHASRESMTPIKTKDGTYLCNYAGNFYRMYKFIDNTVTYQMVENPIHFFNAGRGFGKFQKMLSDFPADTLYETIANFHNTKERYKQFEEAVKNNLANRVSTVTKEIDFVKARKEDTKVIVDMLDKGELPLRVTHNDTKLNNVLMNKETGEAQCVIDLDTVMPSTLLYDFGDAIRSGATTGEEDEVDLSKVNLDLNLFKMFAKGFIGEMKDYLTENEVKYMAFSAKLMTLECGMRFLSDHLNGDTYFKISRPNHNLDRARNQFKLVLDMEKHMDDMQDIIYEIYNN